LGDDDQLAGCFLALIEIGSC